jgi:hypothetical protein
LLLWAVASARALAGADSVCSNVYTNKVPLIDLGTGTYQGYPGGLYPQSSNVRPAAHDRGLDRTGRMVLLGPTGIPDAENGRFVLISIGNSNASLEFSYFMNEVIAAGHRSTHLTLVNCADLDQTADVISDPAAPYWTQVEGALTAAGVTALQVQAVWLKEAIPYPTEGFPGHALVFEEDLRAIVHILKSRYPNLSRIYHTSRIYGGYAPPQGQNPEPYPYEYGFAVKWLIEEQIAGSADLNFDPAKGPVLAPWMSWGPYLWADGIHPRSDGLTWECEDFIEDGAHPSPTGIAKVSERLLSFFEGDSTTVSWFVDCNQDDPDTFALPPEVLEDRVRKIVGGSIEVSWSSLDPVVGSGAVYDVVSGRVGELRADHGFGRATCLVSDVLDTPFTDARPNPPPGGGYYFLVRGKNSCGTGTWGDSSILPDPRDELDAGVPSCL